MKEFRFKINGRTFHAMYQAPSYRRDASGRISLERGLFGIWSVQETTKVWRPYSVPKSYLPAIIGRMNHKLLTESATLTTKYFKHLEQKMATPEQNDKWFAKHRKRIQMGRMVLEAYDHLISHKVLWLSNPEVTPLEGAV